MSSWTVFKCKDIPASSKEGQILNCFLTLFIHFQGGIYINDAFINTMKSYFTNIRYLTQSVLTLTADAFPDKLICIR